MSNKFCLNIVIYLFRIIYRVCLKINSYKQMEMLQNLFPKNLFIGEWIKLQKNYEK